MREGTKQFMDSLEKKSLKNNDEKERVSLSERAALDIIEECENDDDKFSQWLSERNINSEEQKEAVLRLFDGIRTLYKKDPETYTLFYKEIQETLEYFSGDPFEGDMTIDHFPTVYEYLGLENINEISIKWNTFMQTRDEMTEKKQYSFVYHLTKDIQLLIDENIGDQKELHEFKKRIENFIKYFMMGNDEIYIPKTT